MPPLGKSQWPNAEESCGSEVQTTRLGRNRRAWWARGPAIEQFNRDIEPEITAILKNIDMQDTEINIRVYMIGKKEETSRPTVMVCCVDKEVRQRAKESLRASSTLRNNPGFALGSIDYLLEQLVPGRSLASNMADGSVNPRIETGPNSDPMLEVFSTSLIPKIGRRLYITHLGTIDAYPCSTGGVVVEVGKELFQLTVGHICDVQDNGQQVTSSMDSDACSIDGQSESGSEADDALSAFEQNMHRASMSFCEMSDFGCSEDETDSSTSTTLERHRKSTCTVYSDTASHKYRVVDGTPESPPLIKVGKVALHSRDGHNPNLDYALISIDEPVSLPFNEITLSREDHSPILQVRQLATIDNEERRIVSVTSASGVLKGMLIPGTTFLAKGNQPQPQKLHVVQLDGVVAEGDSGAVVVDEVSGDLYGHIISGCPGTRIAYIVASSATFEDLSTRTNGQVSIYSSRKIDKSPAQPVEVGRRPTDTVEDRRREGDAHDSDMPRDYDKRALPYRRVGKRNRVKHVLQRSRRKTGPRKSTSPSGQSLLHVWNPCPIYPGLVLNPVSFSDDIYAIKTLNHKFLSQHDSEAEVKEVEDFTKCSLKELFGPVSWNRQRLTAILDDYATSGGLYKRNSLSEPLTASGLYLRLKELWYPEKKANQSMKSRPEHSNSCGNDYINRRLIFITDLDRWGFTALVATIPTNQSKTLSSALMKYLIPRSSLQVSIPVVGVGFILEFHISFFCWPTRREKAEDSRIRSEGKPLRRCMDVSFLEPDSRSDSTVYEAQISCVITGESNWTWTAYLFTDTYFEEKSPDDVTQFLEDMSDEDEYLLKPDPLTQGTHDTAVPILDPRAYFLIVLQSSHSDAISASESSAWIAKSLDVMKQLQHNLSQTVLELDKFIRDDADYFTDQEFLTANSYALMRTWDSIKHTRHELRRIDSRLAQLIEHCEDFRKDVSPPNPRRVIALTVFKIKLQLNIQRHQLSITRPHKWTSEIILFVSGKLPFIPDGRLESDAPSA
ncbi:hypothetical protein AUP68_15427 [Ilyonectria robusta]